MTPRTQVTPRYESYGPEAHWWLSLDDRGGCDLGHTHDDFGHAFPMTRGELVALRLQIDTALGAGVSPERSEAPR